MKIDPDNISYYMELKFSLMRTIKFYFENTSCHLLCVFEFLKSHIPSKAAIERYLPTR